MTGEFPPSVWFVRSNGGGGSYPVTREGWAAVGIFVLGMVVSGLVGSRLIFAVHMAVGMPVFVIGAVASAVWLLWTARQHTDFTITYSEYLQRMRSKS